jgi:hypothetical protein
LEYDERFIDVTGSCMRIHNGAISFDFEQSDIASNIKYASVNKSEYTKLLDMSIDVRSDT